MTLRYAIHTLTVLAGGPTPIFARQPWSADSEAELVTLDEDGRVPSGIKSDLEARGIEYFLEVDIAREILVPYPGMKSRTAQQVFEFIVYYAEYDAFPDE